MPAASRRSSPIDIAAQRLSNQHIIRPFREHPAALVARLGAVQAQEYPFAKWALGLRLAGSATDGRIETALERGEILRTHVMRPTWHFLAAPDIRWMLELTGPRVLRTMSSYFRSDGIDRTLLARSANLFERALGGGHHLTRADLGSCLKRVGISLTARQLYFVTMHAELDGLICSGRRRGHQGTYALLAERAGAQRALSGDEALAELTRRFFSSHGPATVRDFVWWSGLKTADARRGLDIVKARRVDLDDLTYWTFGGRPRSVARTGTVRLLPIYDEYFVAYRDRVAVPHGPPEIRKAAAVITFWHTLIVEGHAAGTWRTERTPGGTVVRVTALRRLSGGQRDLLKAEAVRYGRFLDTPVTLSVA